MRVGLAVRVLKEGGAAGLNDSCVGENSAARALDNEHGGTLDRRRGDVHAHLAAVLGGRRWEWRREGRRRGRRRRGRRWHRWWRCWRWRGWRKWRWRRWGR